ncbi:MAG: prolyl oligopeptidase family serine peptidase [Planctomycetota bacterium]
MHKSPFVDFLFLALLLLPRVALGGLQADPAGPKEGEPKIESALVIGSVAKRGRVIVFTDAIEATRVRGTWSTPDEGTEVTLPDGTKQAWRRIHAGDDGWFDDPALQGGYALIVVELPSDGAWILDAAGHVSVSVNGEPRVGDGYGLGMTRSAIPLQRGKNELLFRVGRGRLRVRLAQPESPVFLEERDRTLPDVIRGEAGGLWAGVIVTNATSEWQTQLAIIATAAGGAVQSSAVPPLPPFASFKAAVLLPASGLLPAAATEFDVLLVLARDPSAPIDVMGITLPVRDPGETHVRTFVSELDGSVQFYGVTPARPGASGDVQPALVLTLHGAGVDAAHQARCYQPKDWAHIVAPTNRRPFGFDWEDWGRRDALETLAHATSLLDPDPRRIYLTGHSMGGHGTWNLGAQFPGRFAALAPSAGWRDFWSYGGAAEWPNPDPIEQVLERATHPSRTLLLARNYLHAGIYVLHGDADETVPVEQARFMRERLATFHPNWAYYERAGAGHWWGNSCMDWPPLFQFLAQNVLPEAHEIRQVEFTTISPAISARCHWVTIDAQIRDLVPTRVEVAFDAPQRSFRVRTENVRALTLDLRPFSEPRTREIDGRTSDATILPAGAEVRLSVTESTGVTAPSWGVGWPLDGLVHLVRGADGVWTEATPRVESKGRHRQGPFKNVFDRRVVFVHGTRGTPEENAWALAKARYDAETFWYRGNGAIEIRADHEFDPQSAPDRNVVLYGNADTNGAWSRLLDAAPIRCSGSALEVGDHRSDRPDLACLFLYPRPHSDVALVGAVTGTGIVGFRLTDQLPYFVSGVGFPDWIVIGPEMLEQGARGVLGAGFLDENWRASDDAAWRGSD